MRTLQVNKLHKDPMTNIHINPMLLLAALLFPAHPALADTGPKPSVSIRFKGLPADERVYATLIAPADKIFGPAQPASERAYLSASRSV